MQQIKRGKGNNQGRWLKNQTTNSAFSSSFPLREMVHLS
jgi:hypothetical protein